MALSRPVSRAASDSSNSNRMTAKDSAALADESISNHIGATNEASMPHKEYNDDKDDESFLDEVENSLLGKPAAGLMNGNSHSTKTGHSPRHSSPSRTHLHSQYSHMQSQDALDDSPSFRRKVSAGLFYLLCSGLHEGVIYKLAQRTAWYNATIFIPFEFLIVTVIAGLVTLYMKKTSSVQLQHIMGHNGIPLLPSLAWKEALPLAGFTVAATALRVLKDATLEASISTAVSTYIAPALFLILPLIYLSTELPRNGFLILASIAVPTLYGLAITDLHVLSSAIFLSMTFVFVEAGKLAFAKKWFLSKSTSPLEVMLQYLPPATLVALVVIAPISAAMGKQDHLPHRWKLYFIAHFSTSLLNQMSTLVAVNVFKSPVSVALLAIPKGLLVTMFNGGILQGHQRASHSVFVTFAISTLILCMSVPEIRNRLPGGSAANHRQSALPATRSKNELDAETSEQSTSVAYISPRAIRYLAIASFTPILYWFLSQVTSSPIDFNTRLQTLKYYTHSPTVDIVISYYDEELDKVHATIQNLRYYPWIKNRDPRFIIYTKASQENATMPDEEFLALTGADQVYHLKNRGRESGTYLRHILRNYNDSIDPSLAQAYRPAGLADHTLFMQPHLAWEWIAKERLWLFQDNTGYLHFAPYLKLDCGKDMNGNGDFPRLREIYNIFTEELCPPTLQLGAYSSQFVVSKKRILANAYHKYKALDDVLEAEADHWIHTEGTWWKYHGEPGPTNPYFGHAMERAWPTIFGCTDPSISDTCAGETYNVTGCQCFDSFH